MKTHEIGGQVLPEGLEKNQILYNKETLSLTWSNAQIWGTAGPYLSHWYTSGLTPELTIVVSRGLVLRPTDRCFQYYSIGCGSARDYVRLSRLPWPCIPNLAPVG